MIYDYRCDQCRTELSIERSIHAESSAPLCFSCHIVMIRLWSSPPITFSGEGFYSTDS